MPSIAIIDFETTGMSPDVGARPTEVAIVLTEQGRVVDRYQSLMNPGVHIPPFITGLTGITNAMVGVAPPVAQVMAEAARFVGDAPMVAHNASFDRKFWQAELGQLGLRTDHPFACTVLLSRRLYPHAPSHKLGSLAQHLDLPASGRAHRALADAEMTAELLRHMLGVLRRDHSLHNPSHTLLMQLQRCTKAQVPQWLAQAATVLHR
jgi:DNA polymerase-3 subunit epsilon